VRSPVSLRNAPLGLPATKKGADLAAYAYGASRRFARRHRRTKKRATATMTTTIAIARTVDPELSFSDDLATSRSKVSTATSSGPGGEQDNENGELQVGVIRSER
jgi:hypothetical protein